MNPDPAPCGTSSVLPNLVDAMVEVVCEDDRRMSYEHVCLKLKMRVCTGVCMYVCMYVEVRMTDVTTVVVMIRNDTVKMISTVAQVVYNGNDDKSVQAKMAGVWRRDLRDENSQVWSTCHNVCDKQNRLGCGFEYFDRTSLFLI